MHVPILLLALWALSAFGTALTAWRRSRCDKPASKPNYAPVLLVRPCSGADAFLLQNLVSAAHLRAAYNLRVLHLVAQGDPALPIVQAATEQLSACGIAAQVQITHPQGPNYKVAQLAEAVPHTNEHTVWMCVDCDVDLSGFDASLLLQPLGQHAAAWAPFCEAVRRPCTLSDRMSEAWLNGSLHSFPVLAGLDPQAFVGKVMAIKSEALQAIGGWGALTHYLGEDMQIGRLLRAAGLSYVCAPVRARSRVGTRTFAQVMQRYVRWLLVIRAQRPALLVTYPMVFFPTWMLMGMCKMVAIAAPAQVTLAGVIGMGAWCTRLGVAKLARLRCGDAAGFGRCATDMLLADILMAMATLRCVLSRDVLWRGRRMTIASGGKLSIKEQKTLRGRTTTH